MKLRNLDLGYGLAKRSSDPQRAKPPEPANPVGFVAVRILWETDGNSVLPLTEFRFFLHELSNFLIYSYISSVLCGWNIDRFEFLNFRKFSITRTIWFFLKKWGSFCEGVEIGITGNQRRFMSPAQEHKSWAIVVYFLKLISFFQKTVWSRVTEYTNPVIATIQQNLYCDVIRQCSSSRENPSYFRISWVSSIHPDVIRRCNNHSWEL